MAPGVPTAILSRQSAASAGECVCLRGTLVFWSRASQRVACAHSSSCLRHKTRTHQAAELKYLLPDARENADDQLAGQA